MNTTDTSISYFKNLLTLDVKKYFQNKNFSLDKAKNNSNRSESGVVKSNSYFQGLCLIDTNQLKINQKNYIQNLLYQNNEDSNENSTKSDKNDILTLENYKLFSHDITSQSDNSELTEDSSIFKLNDKYSNIFNDKSLINYLVTNFKIKRKTPIKNLKGFFFENDNFLKDNEYGSAFLIGIDCRITKNSIEEYFQNKLNLTVWDIIANQKEQSSIVRVVYRNSNGNTLNKPLVAKIESKVILIFPIFKECRPELKYMRLQVLVSNLPLSINHNLFVTFINDNFGKFFLN